MSASQLDPVELRGLGLKGLGHVHHFRRGCKNRIRFPAVFFYSQRCWQMGNHQIDLDLGESVQIGSHKVTVKHVDAESQQAVLEIEDPDGSVELVAVDTAGLHAEEPALV